MTGDTLTTWLYRPFLDLTPEAPPGNVWTAGLVEAIRAMVAGEDGVRTHGNRPERIRQRIVRQAHHHEFDLWHPRQVHPDLRTEGMARLCHDLDGDTMRDEPEFVRALWVLNRMYLHVAVLYCTGSESRCALGTSPFKAELMLLRGMAHNATAGQIDTSALEWVAANADAGSWSAVEATYLLAATAAKDFSDADAAARWAEAHYRQVTAFDRPIHERAKLMSRYHRVRAFVPHLNGDLPAMVDDLDTAEAWWRKMSLGLERLTVGTALWETRTKEAKALGDFELALERAEHYVELSPTDPLAHTARGEVLVELERYEDAAAAFKLAARYGPPGTEVAYFMLGQCLEETGDQDAAADAYLAGLEVDPLGVAALERLAAVGSGATADWASRRLAELGGAPDAELRPYQRHAGVLGR